jgi:hypothetical protein
VAKKKKKGGAKARKLPKHIAGVKVPKALREAGGDLLAAIDKPLMMDLAAAALSAAATATVRHLETLRAQVEAGRPVAASRTTD